MRLHQGPECWNYSDFISVNKQNQLNQTFKYMKYIVKLQATIKSLEDVVVIGYGAQCGANVNQCRYDTDNRLLK